MPKVKKSAATRGRKPAAIASKVTVDHSLTNKVESNLKVNQSYVSLVLGLLIVLVAGILVFNYFKNNQQPTLGPSQQTSEQQNVAQADVDPSKLPGKYTVKEGDTLFIIAEKYYKDGFMFPKIAEANKLADVNNIEVGLVLDIPKAEEPKTVTASNENTGTGGATNQTIWGEAITGNTYTVAEGDWLSKIAGRAYGDVYAFEKIAKANNITDPNVIEPGMVLKIPR